MMNMSPRLASLCVAAGGVAAFALIAWRRRRQRDASAAPLPREFKLERYFALHEFSAAHLLSCSDVAPLTLKELLAMCSTDTDSLSAWENLSLGYTESQGHPELLCEIAASYESPQIEARHVLQVVPQEGILLTVQAVVEAGDEVIVTWPAYQSLYEVARSRGASVRQWHVRGGGAERLRFDLNDLEDAVAAAGGRPRLIVVNFPHNPTGCHLSRPEFERLVGICRRCGAYLLSDEMYRGITFGSEPPLPAACELYERAVSLSGMSKVYSLPGLRVGWVVCRDADGGAGGLLAKMAALKDYVTICGSAPSEVLALMALRRRRELLQRSKEIVEAGRAAAAAFFSRHAELFHFFPNQAGPTVFPALKGEGLTAEAVQARCDALVAAAGVMIAPASMFEVGLPHFRLGLGRLDFADNLAVLERHLDVFTRAP